MNYGFEQLVYELPTSLCDVETLARQAGFGKDMVDRLHAGGLKQVPVGDGEPLSVLVQRAISKLADEVPDLSQRISGIIFAHSLPILAPSDLPFLELCLKNLGFDEIPRVAVRGQPCAILHTALQLAGCWLCDSSDITGILLIGADQAYSARERIFFGSAMGDAAIAGMLTREARRNMILASISQCEIIVFEGEESPQHDIAQFRQLNPLYIRRAIESCLNKANVKLTDLSYIVPHTPYMMIWDAIAELLRFPRDKILTDYLGETGHLNSNDSFIHYVRAVNEERINDGELALLVNPAFGGTRGCTLIRR